MLETESILDSSHALISSARVEGTPVFGPKGEKLGSVHSVMLHKRTGQAVYALMSFGGFLGVGRLMHPLPWEMLSYDQGQHGYVVDVTREQLEQAPSFALDDDKRPRESEQHMYDYWDVRPYW